MDIAIIFCDNVAVNISNGQVIPSVNTPLNCIFPRHIPGNYSFAVFASVENIPSNDDHIIRLKVYDTERKKIFDSKNIKINSAQKKNNEVYAPIQLSVDIRNTVIEREGCFTAKIYLDDIVIGKKELKVLKSD